MAPVAVTVDVAAPIAPWVLVAGTIAGADTGAVAENTYSASLMQ